MDREGNHTKTITPMHLGNHDYCGVLALITNGYNKKDSEYKEMNWNVTCTKTS